VKHSIIGTIVRLQLPKKRISTKGSYTEIIGMFDLRKEQKSQ